MAGQDTRKLIPAGVTLPISGVNGDFIYLKFADRPVDIILGNSRVTMEAGDKYRPGQRFQGFELENPDPDNPAQVIFTIGEGDYNRQIVQGQITTTLGIKTGTGEFISDTRKNITLDVISLAGSGLTETQFELVEIINDAGQSWWQEIKVANGSRFFDGPAKWGLAFTEGVNKGLLCFGRDSGNKYRLIEIDPFTRALLVDHGEIEDLGQPDSAAVFGNTLFQMESLANTGIYSKAKTDTEWTLIYPGVFRGPMIVANDQTIYFGDGATIRRIDFQGNLLGEISVDFQCGGFGFYKGKLYSFGNTANDSCAIVEPDLSSFVNSENFNPRPFNGITIYKNYVFNSDLSLDLDVFAPETVTNLFAGKAYRVCENAWLGPRPNRYDGVRTGAEIVVTNGETATPNVSGEIIKLALEWYYGTPMPPLYMDLLHGVEIQSSQDQATGVTVPPVEIKSNGQTLLAAKIPDNFNVIFPITVTLTIDQRAEQ